MAARDREFEFEIDLTLMRIVVHAANDIVAADIVHAMTPHELVEMAKRHAEAPSAHCQN